jgi:hypothetical protein
VNIDLYQQHVRKVLDAWLYGKPTLERFTRLAYALGCRHTGNNAGKPVDAYYEHFIIDSWLTVLFDRLTMETDYRTSPDLAAKVELHALAGLLQNDRWKDCLTASRGSYAFVILVSRFLTPSALSDAGRALHNAIQVELDRVLQGWLPGNSISSANDFARSIFGDAWCALVMENQDEWRSVSSLISRDRPPFLPGRLPSQPSQPAQITVELPVFV